ncbi:hypothetical protein [Halomonas denitrificans]|nr:hypothetical protein [Halomonas denitrificans]
MTRNRDPLNLKSLPPLEAPDGLWSDIESALDARSGSGSAPRRGWVPLAMAATVAALALSIALLRGTYGPVPASPDDGIDPLIRLQAVSSALESQLEDYRYGAVSASTADSVARLEQELAWLDVQIEQSPYDPVLWAERVALLGEINQRYIRSDWRSEMMLASY